MKSEKARPTVAVVGASGDPHKYGNRSVRAHVAAGYEVFPVNPRETEIEGLKVYRSVTDIPAALDRITVYLPPEIGLAVIEEMVEKARALGLKPLLACSIINIEMGRF